MRFASDLSPTESAIFELEENIKRRDLEWQELVGAVASIHKLYLDSNPDWTLTETAEALSLTKSHVSKYLKISEFLHDPKISDASTYAEAYNALTRRDQRAIGDALQEMFDTTELVVKPDSPAGSNPDVSLGERSSSLRNGFPPAPSLGDASISDLVAPAQPAVSIHQLSFLDWAPSYSGPKFNLIHCDFPYGIDVFAGGQASGSGGPKYDDSQDIYWQLLTCFCQNLSRFMSIAGHIMFWYSGRRDGEAKTKDFIRANAPSLRVFDLPLVWVKSDNSGLVTDVRRQPRHIYETCLLLSRGDQHLVQPMADAYVSPSDRSLHPSCKPEPMLRHFMTMLVDTNTRFLDPTCGSASSLRAAESLGAREVLGLEIDPEYFETSTRALRKFRSLRRASL